DLFTPERPVVSAKGAVVTNIAHIPAALTAVMHLSGVEPDFAPRGTLALKPWMANDQGLALPERIALRVVQAPAPYDGQIKALSEQVGAVIARQNMKAPPARRRWIRPRKLRLCMGIPSSTSHSSRWKPTSPCRWCTRSRVPRTARCST